MAQGDAVQGRVTELRHQSLPEHTALHQFQPLSFLFCLRFCSLINRVWLLITTQNITCAHWVLFKGHLCPERLDDF